MSSKLGLDIGGLNQHNLPRDYIIMQHLILFAANLMFYDAIINLEVVRLLADHQLQQPFVTVILLSNYSDVYNYMHKIGILSCSQKSTTLLVHAPKNTCSIRPLVVDD